MGVSLAWLPEDGDKPNAAYMHGLLDGSTVFDVGATAFRTGSYILIQPPDVDCPISAPFIAGATGITCGGQSVTLGAPVAYSFSGAHRIHYGMGWHADVHTQGHSGSDAAGLAYRLTQFNDIRVNKTQLAPWHGVARARTSQVHFHWPLVILEEDVAASSPAQACYMGMTRAWIFNGASGHTMLPGQPLVLTGDTDPTLGVLRNFDASAYSMPAGLFCGVLCGQSIDETMAYLPIQFWPYGLVRWPTAGQAT